MIHHVNDSQEFNKILDDNHVIVVDFFATWCGPCRMLAPVLEEIDQEGAFGCDIMKVDVDEVEDVASRYGISSIPTIIIFKDGEPVNVMVGFRGKPQLIDAVKKVLNS
ncbi:MAG: thioredoxin [Bacilli bacterium]|nr:thioredoxin [Bacilli bacterium]